MIIKKIFPLLFIFMAISCGDDQILEEPKDGQDDGCEIYELLLGKWNIFYVYNQEDGRYYGAWDPSYCEVIEDSIHLYEGILQSTLGDNGQSVLDTIYSCTGKYGWKFVPTCSVIIDGTHLRELQLYSKGTEIEIPGILVLSKKKK